VNLKKKKNANYWIKMKKKNSLPGKDGKDFEL